jgi:hypothetical protein
MISAAKREAAESGVEGKWLREGKRIGTLVCPCAGPAISSYCPHDYSLAENRTHYVYLLVWPRMNSVPI